MTASEVHWPSALTAARARWQRLVHTGAFTCGTADRYLRAFQAFSRYAEAHGADKCDGASPEICRRYIYAGVSPNHSPSASTSRVRLAAVRDAYKGLIESGLCAVDPTASLTVERHVGVPALHPLTLPEVDRLQNASRLGTSDTLRPAVVAAALLGALHSEIASLVVADLDLDRASLRLGRATSVVRLVALHERSLETLRARASALHRLHRRGSGGWDPALVPLALHKPPAAYRPQSVAPTVSMNLSRAMRAAGVTRSGVRPRSLREYAANRVYARTGRVEDVAWQLGLRSLDTAFRLVDPGWQERWGEVIRAADTQL
jgi:integrase